MNDELKKIKKLYGEEMMHVCRKLFPTILEKQGFLLKILSDNLAPTHSFMSDIINNNYLSEFRDWIYSFLDKDDRNLITTGKTPFELMKLKGYTLFECKCEEDIQKFKKYYRDDEVICTITNGGRLNDCFVFFAVKNNVDEIKRELFTHPKRDDLYGTSVISIQFTRGENNAISIKNRYNHTVVNSDSTFGNDLENIVKGLTRSFEEYYHLNITGSYRRQEYFLSSRLNYIKANDNKYYRYNLVIDGVYFCENNIIIQEGKVIDKYAKNKERYIVIDQYIIDMQDKNIISYSNCDSFIKSINDVGKIEKIERLSKGKIKEVVFTYENDYKVKIEYNDNNQIIGYHNNYVKKINDDFLLYNKSLKHIDLENVLYIGNNFLRNNACLSNICLPKVLEIDNNFLYNNTLIDSIILPNVRKISNNFLRCNKALNEVSFPNVLMIGDDFIYDNRIIKEINFPNAVIIGNWFLPKNECLEEISLASALHIKGFFLNSNRILKRINIPNVKEIGIGFLKYNFLLTSIDCPSALIVHDDFLYSNHYIHEALFPNVLEIGNSFMYSNNSIRDINFPNVERIGNGFLQCNYDIKSRLVVGEKGISCRKNNDASVKK